MRLEVNLELIMGDTYSLLYFEGMDREEGEGPKFYKTDIESIVTGMNCEFLWRHICHVTL